jgi:hypothetical protein
MDEGKDERQRRTWCFWWIERMLFFGRRHVSHFERLVGFNMGTIAARYHL